jgi:isopenicillin N synthase-like dioxygenase
MLEIGDMMQYLTNSFLKSTPHKVGLNNKERYTIAYFHEPNFQAVVKPLKEYSNCDMTHATPSASTHVSVAADEIGVHYGTHFTNMFMRNYPDRITTKRLLAEDRYNSLTSHELRTLEGLDDNDETHFEGLAAAAA